MAKQARYTRQFSVVGTPTQVDLILRISDLSRESKALVVRAAVDVVLGLIDGELPEGVTFEEHAQAMLPRIEKLAAKN